MSVKINQLEIENVKRVKAVKLEPTENGLTIIGGKNGQGKTSVLDSIAWCLGGEKFRPSDPRREGSVIPPYLHITLSNGLVVERRGENSSLKVIDPNGNKGGQQLLNEFVEQLALNLPKFLQQSNKEKANTLLQVIGVGDKLYEMESEEQMVYNQRHAIGQIADQKTKYAKEMMHYTDVPKEVISVTDLIQQQQQILLQNAENQKKRMKVQQLSEEVRSLQNRIDSLSAEIQTVTTQHGNAMHDLEIARMSAESLQDQSTAELERNISEIESINQKVRTNLDREKAEMDAEDYRSQYDALTQRLEQIRAARMALLEGADLPLPGLSVEKSELTYNGRKWDCMSGAEQLKVATAIVRKLNPNCGFVLLDKLEQMDVETMAEFGAWLEREGLQCIATRVSTGDECSILIEDGQSKPNQKTWKAGEF